MKYIYLLIIVGFFSCNSISHYNKWWINSIHPGIVIGAYEYEKIVTIDSGSVYENVNVQKDIWNKIQIGDTIINK